MPGTAKTIRIELVKLRRLNLFSMRSPSFTTIVFDFIFHNNSKGLWGMHWSIPVGRKSQNHDAGRPAENFGDIKWIMRPIPNVCIIEQHWPTRGGAAIG